MASRADLARLAEGQTLTGVDLTTPEAAALNQSGMVVATPATGGWNVTAQHVVGTMSRAGLIVRIAPKIGAVQVLTLLARADGVRYLRIDAEQVHVDDQGDLSAVLARLFCAEAAHALAGGPLRGYRSEDQTLPVLRGRLRMREQYLRRYGQLHPLEVTVDEWTVDTDENRLIRTAALVLLQLHGFDANLELALRRIDRVLNEASPLSPGQTSPTWTPTRVNARLHSLLALAELAIRHTSVENDPGETAVHGFRLNMATLFERLIARLFEEADPAWAAQSTYVLDARATLTIQPDLVHSDQSGITAVADTKYKVLDEAGKVSNADIYQLVTYCARLGLKTGHLIYADGGAPPAPFKVVGTDVAIGAHRVNMAQSLDDLERDVAHLAQRLSDVREGRPGPSGRPYVVTKPETCSVPRSSFKS